jgi:hypothetical protein
VTITFVFPVEVIEMTLTGEVLFVDEPRALAFIGGGEILRFELHSSNGGTQLILTDELSPGSAARNAAGWDDCLDRLIGRSPYSDAWKPRFDEYVKAFEPALGSQEGPPPDNKGT